MEWLDDLANALPAPREDEPPDLRRKIVAELRDHLHAAMQRELLLTGNAEQAQQNVLSRFGEPARLARKLWYDAMWEKIMTQRMVLAALVLVVLVSVGSTGMTWFLVVQAGQVNQALLEQNRAANELMLAKLAAFGNAPGDSGKSMEWNSLKVRLSLEKPGGAPAANFKLQVEGRLLDTSVPILLSRTTGSDGIADFGLVRPGQHRLNVVSPWGETIGDGHDYPFNVFQDGLLVTVLPGEPQTVEIVCPSKLEEAEVTMTVDWPKELAGQPLWLVCDFVRSPLELGGHSWKRNDDDDGPRFVLIDPSGGLTTNDIPGSGAGRDRSSRSTFKFFPDGESFYVDRDKVMRTYVEGLSSDTDTAGIYRYVEQTGRYPNLGSGNTIPPRIWFPNTAAVSRLKWPPGRYSVSHFAVGLESETPDLDLPDDWLHPEFLGGIALNVEGGDDNHKTAVRLLYPNLTRFRAKHRKRGTAITEIPRFEAVPGRVNEWRLSLPQPLVDLLTEPPVNPETDADTPAVYPAGAYPAGTYPAPVPVDNVPAPGSAREAADRRGRSG